jgi:hypothetical protein
MENITKYQRDDWIFEKVMSEKITDIRPESEKSEANKEFFEERLDELREKNKPDSEKILQQRNSENNNIGPEARKIIEQRNN